MSIHINKKRILTPSGELKWDNLDEIKNDNGTLKRVDGESLSVQKINGKSEEELKQSVNATTLSGKTLTGNEYLRDQGNFYKMLVDTECSHPERWMVALTHSNELKFIGRNANGHFTTFYDEDTIGVITITQPKKDSTIKKLVPSTWALYVLYEDGDLYVIGYNAFGQLGIGNTTQQTKLILSNTNVRDVYTNSVGYHQDYISTFIVKNDGTLWSVGENGVGQLGLGSPSDYNTSWSQVDLTFLGSDSIDKIIIGGCLYTPVYLLSTGGKVYSTGYNNYGQLGLGDTSQRNSFTHITGLDTYTITDVVVAGHTRSGDSGYYRDSVLALTDTGKVFGWGFNGWGELGLGNTTQQNSPVEIGYQWDNTADPVAKIVGSKGEWISFALITQSKKMWTAGHNGYGELGIGNTTNSSTYQFVMDDVEYAQMHATGTYSYHRSVFVIKTDGSVWAWGKNNQGQLGLGDTTQRTSPTEMPFAYGDQIIQVSMGGYADSGSAWVLLDDGRVYGWGDNNYQQVSPRVGSTENIRVPQRWQ